MQFESRVESVFYELSGSPEVSTNIPYVVVENFPLLGLLASLRFLEWVGENPDGGIRLPTGKTPEFVIKWTTHLLGGWEREEVSQLREKYGLHGLKKPSLKNLKFVQIDEFYPISSEQHNSFNNYVRRYYIEGF